MDKTLVKGLTAIEALARSQKARGVTDLAEELKLTKSNVHRLMQTLVAMGYVRKDPASGHYGLSLKLWEIGSQVLSRLDVKEVAASHLKALAEETKETINLSVLDQTEVVYIDKIDSPQPVRAHSRVGGRAPAHSSSTGKAMLAHQPPEVLKSLDPTLRRQVDGKIIPRRAFENELSEIRKLGFALNLGDMTKGVCGVAAPVFGPGAHAIAAVGVAGPAERMRRPTLIRLAPLVRKTALAISAELGHPGASKTSRK